MKKYVLLILVLMTYNLNGQKSIEKSKEKTKHTSISNTRKPDKYKLKDPVNFTDFEVTYNWNDDDEKYSSSDSIFQKRYSNTIRKVKFGLTKEEKALIYKTVKEIDFYNLPKELEMRDDIMRSPSFSTEISIKIGKTTHKVYDFSNFIKDKSIETRFGKIVSVIRKIIFEKKGVKALPETDLIYL